MNIADVVSFQLRCHNTTAEHLINCLILLGYQSTDQIGLLHLYIVIHCRVCSKLKLEMTNINFVRKDKNIISQN